MPLFEYRCKNNHITDHIVSYEEKGPIPCPECAQPATRVLVPSAAPSVHYKGNWYKTTKSY